MARGLLLLGWLSFVLACGDERRVVTDGGADSGEDAAGDAFPSAPRIGWLDEGAPPIAAPVLVPCPDGWLEADVSGVSVCEPYPPSGRASCSAGEAHFPGEPDCRPVGDPCPSGEFAPDLPAGSTIYVQAGAAAGGDGSLTRPFGALAEVGWETAVSGTVVALSKGDHPGPVHVRGDVSVVGACAAETRIVDGFDIGIDPLLRASGGEGQTTSLRNVTLVGGERVGVRLETRSTLHLRGVVIDDSWIWGVYLEYGHLLAEDVVIMNTRQGAEGSFGIGIDVTQAGVAELRRAVFIDNQRAFYTRGRGSRLTAEDVLVTIGNARGGAAEGFSAFHDSEIEVHRAVIDGPFRIAVAMGIRGSVHATDLVVRGLDERGQGFVVAAFEDVTGTFERVYFDQNDGTALFASGIATIDLSDIVFRGPVSRDREAALLRAQSPSTVTLERTFAEGANHFGVLADGAGAEVTIRDVRLERLRSQASTRTGGLGLVVQNGGHVDAERIAIREAAELGARCSGSGSSLRLVDGHISDMRSNDDGYAGRGIAAHYGGTVEVRRTLIERARDAAIYAYAEGSVVTAEDVSIRSTLLREGTPLHGWGALIMEGAFLDMSRTRIEESFAGGILVHTGGRATLSDVEVLDTETCPVESPECDGNTTGHGIISWGGAVTVTRFAVRRAASCGIMVSEDGELDASVGIVEQAAVGACIQVDDYDFGRLSDGVLYRDNGTSLDSTMLPVPDPGEVVETSIDDI